MLACVVHNTLNPAGGGERVCLETIRALKELGFRVRLITTEPTDWNRIKRLAGTIVRPDEEVSVLPFKAKMFGIYMRLLTTLRLLLTKKKCHLTVNTHGDVLPIPLDIVYMHFPTFALIEYSPVNLKYRKSLFWRLYFEPYRAMQQTLVGLLRYSVILTNSRFSSRVIERYVGKRAFIVYPPVDIEVFLRAAETPPEEREDIVVTCGRFSPEKNHELVIKVAELLPDTEFYIIGSRSGKVSGSYIAKLKRIIERRGLKNVHLLVDYPRRDQVQLYSRGKVYLHPMVNEHFGIAVVEGMAAGLVPVVHRSGGPWLDIVEEGRWGLGFSTIEEAAEAVEKALRQYKGLRAKALKRAKTFTPEAFKRRMKGVIQAWLETCGGG